MRIKLSIKHKVAAVFIAVGIILVFGVASVVYAINYRQVAEQYTGIAYSSAQIAAAIVDGDSLEGYLLNGPDAGYQISEGLLRELKVRSNLAFLYIVRFVDDQTGFVYVFDIFADGDDPSLIFGLGDIAGESELEAHLAAEIYLTGQSARATYVTKTEFGYLATAYAPVLNPDGEVVAVACADISMDTILHDIRMQTLIIAGVVLGITVMSLIAILLIVNKSAISRIIALSRHMSAFKSNEGNFEKFHFTQTGDEIQAMAESFNAMVDDIKIYIDNLAATTAEKERIGAELDVATRIQASLLPCIFPAFPGREEFDIYASMLPAKEVGGDFYDFFLVDDATLAVVMADVSGKGVPAALFMVIAKTLIKNNAQTGKSPGDVFETVNNMLCENNDAEMFVTAFMGYLNLQSGRFTYVNAGHNPPLIKKAGGEYAFLKEKPSLILASFDGIKYKERQTDFSAGDVLYLYTDGVTEAMNINEALFLDSRLIETANCHKDCPVRELVLSIGKEVDRFAEGAEQSDDITMLALRFNGNGEKTKKGTP